MSPVLLRARRKTIGCDDPVRVVGLTKRSGAGGPAYRIGLGGGAASSMVQGENKESLDFDAVQRGDAEMEQKTNRVIRACVEMGADNPIVSIHDQGAGGNCNVLKEIVEPAGGQKVCGAGTLRRGCFSHRAHLGDPCMTGCVWCVHRSTGWRRV